MWLRLLGVKLYASLDDLLIMGDPKVVICQSIQKTVQVLVQAGFVVNLKKSELVPIQDMVYIGARFRMDLGRLYLLEIWSQALITCIRSFSKVGAYKPVLQLLELMAAMLQLVEYAHHQWYLKQCWSYRTHGLHHSIFVSKDLVCTLLWWLDRQHLSQGMPFMSPSITITMDASMEGWDGHCIMPG